MGPTTLADLQKGNVVEGDSGVDASKPPKWYDAEKFARGGEIFARNAFNFVLTWHFSLVMGFCVKPLLEALVFTGQSSTPKESVDRYIRTYTFLATWHLGDVFDTKDDAYRSVQTVRTYHATVRKSMEKKNKIKKMTQYDMCLVQTGFMGALVITPRGFGMRLSDDDIDAYVYFWRCVARQLGIMDKFNLCGEGYKASESITWEVVDKVLLPSEFDAPEPDYDTIVNAYVRGMNSILLGLPFWSLRAMQAFSYATMGRTMPGPRLSCCDRIRLFAYKCLIALLAYAPGFNCLANALVMCVTRILIRRGSGGGGGGGICPFVGKNDGAKRKCPRARNGEPTTYERVRLIALFVALLAIMLIWVLVVPAAVVCSMRRMYVYL